MANNSRLRRCAVYTRKSSEEGLQQEFNSLDAQREAGVAYVRSQAGEGWRLVETEYDDGGISGGTLERPALRRLLEDIAAGKIHVIVVYKVDRLTRSLSDFAKLIEVFEKHAVSFVSVTQQFNTTTSMGRLMLNVLLSFAQFEREVTGERIRDKIAASKRKGMWMGGTPPIGYEVKDRKLVVVAEEAELIRHIFRRYSALGSITSLARELISEGIQTRHYKSAAGRAFGGKTFSRGHLHRILSNRLYLGEVVHQEVSYAGEHDAIVDAELWASVERKITENRNGHRGPTVAEAAPLRGKIFDAAGNRMTPAQARKGARRYRYYVSRAVVERGGGNGGSVSHVPAPLLEAAVLAALRESLRAAPTGAEWKRELLQAPKPERVALLYAAIRRVVVFDDRLEVEVDTTSQSDAGAVGAGQVQAASVHETLCVPFSLERRAGSVRVLQGEGGTAVTAPDPSLVRTVLRGHEWARRMLGAEAATFSDLAREGGVTPRYVSRIVRYAFLAPDITEAILSGTQPTSLTIEVLRDSIPSDWSEQRRIFGLRPRLRGSFGRADGRALAAAR